MANEKQRLVFTAANENLGLAFRKTGSSTLSATWHPGASNSSLVTLLESLYGSGNVAVTGSLTPTGSVGNRTYSGTLTVDFSGDLFDTDVEQIEVRTGPAYNFLVGSGDGDSDYSADGGATFALGISQADFQTNQRNIGGAHAAVVCIGSSESTGSDYVVSGTTIYDGTYVEFGTHDGKPYYKLGGQNKYLFFDDLESKWGIYNTLSLSSEPSESYTIDSTAGSPPSSGWFHNVSIETTAAPGVSVTPSGGATSADFKTYFPPDVTPSAPSATGTDATNTVAVAKGASTFVVPSTLTQGNPLLVSNLDYNLVTGDTVGDVIDLGSAGTTGWTAMLQVAESTDTDAVLSAVLKGSTTGTFGGEETETCTFDDISDRGGQVIESVDHTSALNRYQRLELTITGGADPGFALHAAIAKGRTDAD